MNKVIIVDDDQPVLEFIEKSIPWQALNLQLVGAFENGMLALEQAQVDMPDIVITDISMPHMNGLELTKRLKELNPSIRIVILSCYNEFEYAQQAVKLNVSDYILKETIKPEGLIAILQRLRDEHNSELIKTEHNERLEHLASQNKSLLKENFIRGTIKKPITDPIEWHKKAREFQLDLQSADYMLVLGYMDGYEGLKSRYNNEDVLTFALENVTEEVLRECRCVFVRYSSNEFFLLFPIERSFKATGTDKVEPYLQQIQHTHHKYLKISVSFITHQLCRNPDELRKNMNSILEETAYRFYLPASIIVKHTPWEYASADLFAFYQEAHQEFRDILLHGDPEDVRKCVDKWLNLIEQAHYHPEVVIAWILKLTYDLQIKIRSMQHFQTSYSSELLHQEISRIDSAQQLRAWLMHYFQIIIPEVGKIVQQTKNNEIQEAIKFAQRNIDKKFALEEVANHLHLNPSYLSRLFKKETGENLVEYVNRIKIERAKELLDQTNKSIEEICEQLGFEYKSYFTKVFKTITGMTPGEYRG